MTPYIPRRNKLKIPGKKENNGVFGKAKWNSDHFASVALRQANNVNDAYHSDKTGLNEIVLGV
jgi:hypothetical protein